jgi:hypothetical protein
MAWQLIYTSAPRLLDAGRTGFGTVARHRAVSGLLASTIERFSQFARLPGFDTKRVVYNHRLLTVGSGEFHVLSCLRDAGSDYTGRTNHLAHHIIAEAREIRNLGLAGITPADILLGMPWLETWTSSPRFLESADEINLSTFRNPESHEWQRLTGNLHHALLPWSPSAKKGLYFVLPPGLDARPLILESLQEHPGESWKIPFTTCLEPNDDVADFKWIAVPATSPLCPQPGTAARLILDLTQPAQLPAPPSLPTETHYSEAASAPSPATLNTPAPTTPSPDLPLPSSSLEFPSTAPVPAWSPTPAQSKKSLGLTTRLLIGSAAAIVMIGGALLISNFINQRVENRRVAEVIKEIDRIWKEQQPNLNQTLTFLKDKARTDPNLPAKLKELETQFATIRESLKTGVPTGPIIGLSMNLEPDFGQLQDANDKWVSCQSIQNLKSSWENQPPGLIQASLATALNQEETARQQVAKHFKDLPAPSKEWHARLHQDIINLCRQSTAKPQGTGKEWNALLDLIKPGENKPDWLGLWVDVEELPATDRLTKLDEFAKRLAKYDNVPGWLPLLITAQKEKAQSIADKTKPSQSNATNTAAPPSKTLNATADTIDATHPIHLLVLPSVSDLQRLANQMLAQQTLELKRPMRLWVGSLSAPAIDLIAWKDWTSIKKPPAGDLAFYKDLEIEQPNTIKITKDRLVLELPLAAGLRLVASDLNPKQPEILFELRVKTQESNVSQLFQFSSNPNIRAIPAGTDLLIPDPIALVSRLNIVGRGKIRDASRLELVSDTDRFALTPISLGGEWKINSNTPPPPIGQLTSKEIRLKIQTVEAKKRFEETRQANDAKRKLSDTAKSSLPDNKLQEIEAELTSLKADLSRAEEAEKNLPKVSPKPGKYALEVLEPDSPTSAPAPPLRLCIIELTIQQVSNSPPK